MDEEYGHQGCANCDKLLEVPLDWEGEAYCDKCYKEGYEE